MLLHQISFGKWRPNIWYRKINITFFIFLDKSLGYLLNWPVFEKNCFRKKHTQKQSPEVFYVKGVLRKIAKLTGKHLCQSLILNKVAGLRTATLLKKRLWFRCFPVNFVKFLKHIFYRTPLVAASEPGRLSASHQFEWISQR